MADRPRLQERQEPEEGPRGEGREQQQCRAAEDGGESSGAGVARTTRTADSGGTTGSTEACRSRSGCRPGPSGQGAGSQAQDGDDDELPQHQGDQGVDQPPAPVGDGRPRQTGQGQRQEEHGHVHGGGPDQELDPDHQRAEHDGQPAHEHDECRRRWVGRRQVADSPMATEARKCPLFEAGALGDGGTHGVGDGQAELDQLDGHGRQQDGQRDVHEHRPDQGRAFCR